MLAAAWLFSLPRQEAMVAATLVGAVLLFVALVAAHGRARAREQHARALRDLSHRGAARVRREWATLPAPAEVVRHDHPYAVDLDVAGTPTSLYRLLDVVSPATGRPMLLRWLLTPASTTSEVLDRQGAVRELTQLVALRDDLALLARRAQEMSPEEFEGLLGWAEGPPWFAGRPVLLWVARVIPVLTIVTAVLAVLGRLPSTAPGLSIIAGLLVLARYRTSMTEHLTSVLRNGTGLRPQRQMLEQLAAAKFAAPLLVREQERAVAGITALRSLDRVLSLFEGQGSLIHAIFAAVLLWDAQAIATLDRWRRRHGPRVRGSLDALGIVEALAALATLAHDNPSWQFPTLDASSDRLTSKRLGHPLLPASVRVGNDVTVGPAGTLLLVTGSNMSGKSTLLRAIGLNAVLAQAGAPVCADALTMPMVDVRTSIRLADSLERGVSLFMAELERLKQIVDAARDTSRTRPLLYLLDEILHGTNTAERLIAARTVLDHLVKAGAIGAVTTHDLTLAADGSLASASRPVYFTEQVQSAENGDGTQALAFDYKLRPGLATSTNALKLLALVGLDK